MLRNRTENGYPLNIEVITLKYEESPYDKQFLFKMLPKINYPALRNAVQQMNPHCSSSTPLPELPEHIDFSSDAAAASLENLDEDTCKNLYKVLFDVYLMEGWLVCPDTGRKFPVKDGIPNMILHEDEI